MICFYTSPSFSSAAFLSCFLFRYFFEPCGLFLLQSIQFILNTSCSILFSLLNHFIFPLGKLLGFILLVKLHGRNIILHMVPLAYFIIHPLQLDRSWQLEPLRLRIKQCRIVLVSNAFRNWWLFWETECMCSWRFFGHEGIDHHWPQLVLPILIYQVFRELAHNSFGIFARRRYFLLHQPFIKFNTVSLILYSWKWFSSWELWTAWCSRSKSPIIWNALWSMVHIRAFCSVSHYLFNIIDKRHNLLRLGRNKSCFSLLVLNQDIFNGFKFQHPFFFVIIVP